MSNARTLANAARITFGSLASKSTIATADITDSAITTAKIAADSVTAAKLGTNEKRQIVRAFGYINGTTGDLVAGFGLTAARSATGTYTVTLSSAAPDTNYTVLVTGRHTTNLTIDEQSGTARTTTVIPLRGRNTSTGTASDVAFYSVSILW